MAYTRTLLQSVRKQPRICSVTSTESGLRSVLINLGFVVTGIDPSGDLKWKADYWLVNDGTEVEVQGNHGWRMEDIIAMLESIQVKRVGF